MTTRLDEREHCDSGEVCTLSHGSEMIYLGHLCEGANLTTIRDVNFCLWTRCQDRDVPADQAHRGDIREVTCLSCLALWNAENGQFGVGA